MATKSQIQSFISKICGEEWRGAICGQRGCAALPDKHQTLPAHNSHKNETKDGEEGEGEEEEEEEEEE